MFRTFSQVVHVDSPRSALFVSGDLGVLYLTGDGSDLDRRK